MRPGDDWRPIKRLHGSPAGTLPPRTGPSSALVWLLFADGRVLLGSCYFRSRMAPYPDAVHSWSTLKEWASAGSPGWAIGSDEPAPIAWQPLQRPPAPPLGRRNELRNKVEA